MRRSSVFLDDAAPHCGAGRAEGSTLRVGSLAFATTECAEPLAWRAYDASPDGQRFLLIKEGASDASAPAPSFVVVQNWIEELNRLVPKQ